MAYGITKQNGVYTYGYTELTVDSADDIANLPVSFAFGSTALVVADSSLYVLVTDSSDSSKLAWKKMS